MTDENVSNDEVVDTLDDGDVSLPPQDEDQTPKETEESSPSPDALTDKAQKAVNDRIAKITAQKYVETQRANTAEKELADFKSTKEISPQQSSEAPKLEDFDFDEGKYSEALINYKVDQRFAEQASSDTQKAQDDIKRNEADGFAVKQATYSAENTDYEDSIKNLPVFPDDTLHAIMSMEDGPKMAHYLGKHLDVADEIANASPMNAAIKLGRIAAKMDATTKKVETTNAPDPIETLKPGSSSISKEADGIRYE